MRAITNLGCNTNDEQAALWNGVAGHSWVEAQPLLDRMFKPFEDLLVNAVFTASASRVLDIGCGTGATTLAVARLLSSEGGCVGIDISETMIASAHSRSEQEGTSARFIRGDAQRYAFEPLSFDMMISRFGVMFFSNPVVAFANLRRAAKKDAELRFVTWRSSTENPFMTTAERAAAPLLPKIPQRQPDAPGPFALADQRRIYSVLKESGWAKIDIQPIDVSCTLPERELIGYLAKLGPIVRILYQADERTRTQVMQSVRNAFDPFVHGADVRFLAACWIVSALSGP